MTGGGFGGCTITLVESSKKDAIMKALKEQYKEKTGIDCDIIVTTPCQGCHVIKNERCGSGCKCNKDKSSCNCPCKCIKAFAQEHPILVSSVVVGVIATGVYCFCKHQRR